jgi:hypothetical protein
MIDSSLVLSLVVSLWRSDKQCDKKDIVLFSSYEARLDWEHLAYQEPESQHKWMRIHTVRAFPLSQGTLIISSAFFFHLGTSLTQPAPGNQDGKFLSIGITFYE